MQNYILNVVSSIFCGDLIFIWRIGLGIILQAVLLLMIKSVGEFVETWSTIEHQNLLARRKWADRMEGRGSRVGLNPCRLEARTDCRDTRLEVCSWKEQILFHAAVLDCYCGPDSKANRFTGNVALICVGTKKSNYGKELESAFLLSLSMTVLKDQTVKIYSYREFRKSAAIFIWFLLCWLC
jgi:hypothetical protein